MRAGLVQPNQPGIVTAGEDILRSAFVEMLFALAASQVAIHAADLVSVAAPLWDKAPAFAHLGVGLLLIAASWVGWRQSVSPGMKEEKVKYLFSVPFLGLLLDVLLVILYFIIVRNVEIEQKDGSPSLAATTAVPESSWLCVVFGVYAFWDLVADVFSAGCIPKSRFVSRAWKAIRAGFVSAFTSLFCLLLSYLVYVVATTRTEADEVLFLDGMLVCAILFFRVLKASENVMARHLRVTDCKAFEKPRETQGSELWLGIALLILYVVFFLGAHSFQLSEAPKSLFG